MKRNDATAELIGVLQGLLPQGGVPYALHEPELSKAEEDLVLEALREGYVSYAGRHVALFEKRLSEVCGTADAIAMVSGTAAIHAVLMATGVGAGDEVLCPSLTFVATANAIVHSGAVPHFVDCTEDDLGIDVARLDAYLGRIAAGNNGTLRNKATGRRIAAVMPVHIFGHIGNMTGLREIARKWSLPIIEDSTEALGSRDDEGLVFRSGVASVLSFNGNKVVTTGGGGAVLTDDREFAKRLKHLTTTAKKPHAWRFDHDEIGYNYRMPNINAAVGLAQLSRLDDFVERKRRLATAYRKAFEKVGNWSFVAELPGRANNYWLNAVRLPSADFSLVESTLGELHKLGYLCRPCWTPMHQLSMFATNPRDDLPVTEDMAARIICLPSSPKLADAMKA